jgi:chromosome segregation ATPase
MLVSDIIPSIVYGAVLLFMLGAIAALWSRMGNILRDIGRLDADVAGNRTALNERTDSIQTALNERTDSLQTALNEKTDSLQTALNEKTDALQISLNEKTNALNVKTDTLQTSLNELKNTFAEMQLQIQRNHYQMMMAILSHSHRPDGRPTFDLPPNFEPAPAEE